MTTFPIAVGILGATVMPHSLFLGSALATHDRISFRTPHDAEGGGSRNTVSSEKDTDDSLGLQNRPTGKSESTSEKKKKVSKIWRLLYEKSKKYMLDAFLKSPAADQLYERENNSFEFVRAHIYYGMFDIVGSLLGFAVMINSL